MVDTQITWWPLQNVVWITGCVVKLGNNVSWGWALVRWCVGALGRWGVVTEARPYGGTNLEPVLLPIFLLSSSISSIYGGGRPNSILLPSIHIAEE